MPLGGDGQGGSSFPSDSFLELSRAVSSVTLALVVFLRVIHLGFVGFWLV